MYDNQMAVCSSSSQVETDPASVLGDDVCGDWQEETLKTPVRGTISSTEGM